jgi:hypothetical protein
MKDVAELIYVPVVAGTFNWYVSVLVELAGIVKGPVQVKFCPLTVGAVYADPLNVVLLALYVVRAGLLGITSLIESKITSAVPLFVSVTVYVGVLVPDATAVGLTALLTATLF